MPSKAFNHETNSNEQPRTYYKCPAVYGRSKGQKTEGIYVKSGKYKVRENKTVSTELLMKGLARAFLFSAYEAVVASPPNRPSL